MLWLIQRGLAYVIDALIIYAIWSFCPFSIVEEHPAATKFVIAVVYLSFMDIAFAASLGKQLLGLEVLSSDGEYANPIQLLLRNILKMAGIYMYFINYISVPLCGKAIHDFLTKTEVVETDDDEYAEEYE